jgi:hypothetical protein
MGEKMKKRLLVILFALVLGGSIAYFMFSRKYLEGDDMVPVKAFQIGVYTHYDNAIRVAERNNGIVVNDQDVYRVYVAILSSNEAVEIMRTYYDNIGLKYYLKDITVTKEFLESIKSTEELLIISNSDTYNVINLSVLNKYEDIL